MSEATEGVAEQGETSITRTGLAVMTVIAVLAVALGLMTAGFIPTVRGASGHGATVTSTARGQFITITTTEPAVTNTVTAAGGSGNGTTVTITSGGANSTETITSISEVTATSTSTDTLTSISEVTLTSTTTSLTTTTTTTTTTPTNPLVLNVSLGTYDKNTFYAGNTFDIEFNVQSMEPSTQLSLSAYQETPNQTPNVISFFPQLPENVVPLVGLSTYRIQGTVSPYALPGLYVIDVEMQALISENGGTIVTNDLQQFLIQVNEPITFSGYSFPTSNSQFNGTCNTVSYTTEANATWNWECGLYAAPGDNGTLSFEVSNASNSPMCLQTSVPGAAAVTGYVDNDPYPFCPGGATGVYVPAGAVDWPITYLLINGPFAGKQIVFFTFER